MYKSRDVLFYLYVMRRKGVYEIADILGCGHTTVQRWLKRLNVPTRTCSEAKRGDLNPSWKNGRHIDSSGYIVVWNPLHPNANCKGRVLEHRLVLEDKLRRYLEPEEVVHHINESRADNRVSNLRLFPTNGAHVKHHK